MENGRVLDEYKKALMEIHNLSKTRPLDLKKNHSSRPTNVLTYTNKRYLATNTSQ